MKINYVLILLLFMNCASANAGLALSNTPISKKYKIIAPIKKTKSWVTFDIGFIGVPFKKPPIDALMNEILSEQKADALVNIRYWNDKMVFLFITVNRVGISGEAVKFQEESETKKTKKR